jgi:hypothetical protein
MMFVINYVWYLSFSAFLKLHGIMTNMFSFFSFPSSGRLTAQGGVLKVEYRGITHAIFSIWRKEGFRSLYGGLVPTLLGVAPCKF